MVNEGGITDKILHQVVPSQNRKPNVSSGIHEKYALTKSCEKVKRIPTCKSRELAVNIMYSNF
jgi:hypothetical protein